MNDKDRTGRRVRLSADERRDQIIQVTATLVADRGFWGLSTQDVADACGITVPGLLHHFGSKTTLLLAVLTDRDEKDAQALAAELQRDEPDAGVSALRHLCSSIVRRNVAVPEVVRLFVVLQGEALTPTHPAHDYFQDRGRMAIATMTQMANEVTDEPDVLARQLVALLDGLILQWLQERDGMDLVALWEVCAEPIFAGLQGAG